MNQKKAKILRRYARAETTNFNRPRYPASRWGVDTFMHLEGTYRRIYQDAKRGYKQAGAA